MLDLHKIMAQISNMSSDRIEGYKELGKKVDVAQKLLCDDDFSFKILALKKERAKTSWLVAEPTEDFKAYALHRLPSIFQVLAVDGSQIVPDHHEIALCYLINTGAILLTYGVELPPIMESFPNLYYADEDLYIEYQGQKVLVQGELLSLKRAIAEAERLSKLVAETVESYPVVSLCDGTLIQWNLESQGRQSESWKDSLLDTFLGSLEECRVKNIPVAGYISGSRSNDVVNLLRLGLCPEMAPNCDQCQFGINPPCKEIEGTRDVLLFKNLQLGERTSTFYSNSKVLEKYGEHKIGFFYINVGAEIVRVEAPAWVLKNQNSIDLVHAVIFDQAQKGLGYPVVLSEAHELAVIKGTDRQLFFNILAEYYVQKGIPVEFSLKSLSKRRPLV